jgi:hypothetical protein
MSLLTGLRPDEIDKLDNRTLLLILIQNATEVRRSVDFNSRFTAAMVAGIAVLEFASKAYDLIHKIYP